MIPDPPCCPQCGSRRLIRYGIVAGKQRWRCKRCRYQFTRLEGHGTPEPTKRAAVSLYGYGLSFNAVADLLGTTAQSVLRWVCGYVDRCCARPPPGEAVVIELDEMWHFLQRKDNKVWIQGNRIWSLRLLKADGASWRSGAINSDRGCRNGEEPASVRSFARSKGSSASNHLPNFSYAIALRGSPCVVAVAMPTMARCRVEHR